MDNNFGVKCAVLLRTLDVFYRLRGPNIYSVGMIIMDVDVIVGSSVFNSSQRSVIVFCISLTVV